MTMLLAMVTAAQALVLVLELVLAPVSAPVPVLELAPALVVASRAARMRRWLVVAPKLAPRQRRLSPSHCIGASRCRCSTLS